MTPAEAAALLAVAAAFDNRRPDADAAQAWSLALHGYRFEDCRDVIVQHYRTTGDWLMPHHVLTAVKKMRTKRLDEAVEPPPPPDLTPLETLAWLKDIRRRIANGEDVSDQGRGELEARDLPELRALIQRGPVVNSAQVPVVSPVAPPAPTETEPETEPAAEAVGSGESAR
jgi:hypothetical protein